MRCVIVRPHASALGFRLKQNLSYFLSSHLFYPFLFFLWTPHLFFPKPFLTFFFFFFFCILHISVIFMHLSTWVGITYNISQNKGVTNPVRDSPGTKQGQEKCLLHTEVMTRPLPPASCFLILMCIWIDEVDITAQYILLGRSHFSRIRAIIYLKVLGLV